MKRIKESLTELAIDAYTSLNHMIGNPIDRDYAAYSLKEGGKYGVILGAAAVLAACNPNQGDDDNDGGYVPDTTAPTLTLDANAQHLLAEASDGSGVDLSLFVDKNKNSIFETSEQVDETSAAALETASLDVAISSISGLTPGQSYDAEAQAVDKSAAANSSLTQETFTVPLRLDVTTPYSPTVTGSAGTLFGQIDLDILINGDDISNQASENVSGLKDTKFYAMPITADFTKADLQTYGTLLDTFFDDAGSALSKSYTLSSMSADYAIYSLTTDNEGNETLDIEDVVRSGGGVPLGHRFLVSIAGYTSGDIDIYGVVGSYEELLGTFTPDGSGNANISLQHYVDDETVALRYNGNEQQFTYGEGELDTVNF